MSETLEQSRERLMADADRLPGVCEALAIYAAAAPAAHTSAHAETIRLTVLAGANATTTHRAQ